jgi:hypothetical protein
MLTIGTTIEKNLVSPRAPKIFGIMSDKTKSNLNTALGRCL